MDLSIAIWSYGRGKNRCWVNGPRKRRSGAYFEILCNPVAVVLFGTGVEVMGKPLVIFTEVRERKEVLSIGSARLARNSG